MPLPWITLMGVMVREVSVQVSTLAVGPATMSLVLRGSS